ncbi:hyaluronidase-5-like [Corythoichthys intestinalis]|uniref:hyaluronidase-5-like n=1 Tax=Corythoichthys intestinalis TaxID=161448 RepID=UPI0025A68ACB|nr:hyaluronidase-5-like [Corythoichthys intestinalis]XP_057691728.1 hyaluronidase-5-like [Corythoichthys intestinalis]XP_057691729.1 hyaluronidase-5-like [Corythoichthys intestinalis]XP_057691730.1 hyaluronidase-5-like [Corythoichthys intestinalis]XP_057691731.1 hyaluronidase-5-like [Corythoichthys intestinalis]XP_057691733.1 hyaluronidase-5-like [Corythoichthys intestinalis]XP_057691734.1 hyaluronidase-5-like [Corythoichthys intestinalis]XP_061812976.1 hyaluronidase-5-like [Nerophis lumbric
MQQNVACLVAILFFLGSSRASFWTSPPIKTNHPFLFMWNAPTELCETHFGLPLDLSHFHLVSSTLKSATNQSISIFYTDRFGIVPHVDEDTGEFVDDGLPQLVDLKEHRELAEDDIEFYIPDDNPGLAVLDLEEWRPQWIRNWGSKDIYRQISIDRVKARNSSLSDEQAEERAKMLFERAAKRYFLRSLLIGKRLRPKRLWGYYLYPDCYNYDYNQDMVDFSGECPEIEKERNDELLWLWRESTALYPSIYLEVALQDSAQARRFVRHRLVEAARVSALANDSYSIPVYAYIRPVYKDKTDKYLSEMDLVNTIGEAAALGAAGVVSWGDMAVTESEDSCFDARRHLENVMNPYILNVSTATRLCSEALCQSRGRCVRKRWDEDVYLHLDGRRYRIEQRHQLGPLTVSGGGLSQDDVHWFSRHFDCMCYNELPCQSAKTLNTIQDSPFSARSHSCSCVQSVGVHFLLMVTATVWLQDLIG